MSGNLIPLSGTHIAEFVPSAFNDRVIDQPTFFVRTPTFAMRDKMAAVLFQRGLIPTTTAQSRGILIDALYDIHEETVADDYAAFLESFWTREEVHQELVNAWQIQEANRLVDVAQGVKSPMPQVPIPPAPYTMREQARQARIVTEALDRHEFYRSYQARILVQQEEEDAMTMRLFLDGWKNCGEAKASRDEMDRLTEDSVEQVRQWLVDEGAPEAWNEVKNRVRQQFGQAGITEKNSDSPLDTNSSQTGSQTSSGDLEISDGSSTTSPIEQTREPGSQETSASSRNSRSARKGKRRQG